MSSMLRTLKRSVSKNNGTFEGATARKKRIAKEEAKAAEESKKVTIHKTVIG
jgi:hypothetical protein